MFSQFTCEKTNFDLPDGVLAILTIMAMKSVMLIFQSDESKTTRILFFL